MLLRQFGSKRMLRIAWTDMLSRPAAVRSSFAANWSRQHPRNPERSAGKHWKLVTTTSQEPRKVRRKTLETGHDNIPGTPKGPQENTGNWSRQHPRNPERSAGKHWKLVTTTSQEPRKVRRKTLANSDLSDPLLSFSLLNN